MREKKMSKIEVESEKLDNLLFFISIADEFCAICPNCKISCPGSKGTVAENSCREALYKYVRGKEK